MNVILLGYRGCGKTTVGRAVARALGWRYVDVDDATREAFDNATIAEIWQRHGEPAWREAEVAATRRLVAGREQVIGLGGGTLMQPGAREAVEAAEARRVYLHAPP
ncbi:MAG: shikimate kinase, partial [Phycisphaeraceae bacterium]